MSFLHSSLNIIYYIRLLTIFCSALKHKSLLPQLLITHSTLVAFPLSTLFTLASVNTCVTTFDFYCTLFQSDITLTWVNVLSTLPTSAVNTTNQAISFLLYYVKSHYKILLLRITSTAETWRQTLEWHNVLLWLKVYCEFEHAVQKRKKDNYLLLFGAKPYRNGKVMMIF